MAPLDRRTFNRSLLAVPAAALTAAGLSALSPAAASAAPADWDAHYLVGSRDGELQHRMRRGDNGSWSPSWDTIGTADGRAHHVSCFGMYNGLNVVAALNEGPLSHGIRKADGTWTEFTPIPSTSGPNTGAPRVAVTARDRVLHVFSASEEETTLYYTIRDRDGNWSPSWSALRTFAGIRQIATTRVDSAIATAVVTGVGRLRCSIQASDGTWGGWLDLGNKAGEIGGFYRVALAGRNGQLHVFARGQDYGVYHAIRRTDGSWRQFRNLSVFENHLPIEICAANIGGVIHVGIVEYTANGLAARYSILRADGTWRSVGTISGSNSGFVGQPWVIAVGGTERTL